MRLQKVFSGYGRSGSSIGFPQYLKAGNHKPTTDNTDTIGKLNRPIKTCIIAMTDFLNENKLHKIGWLPGAVAKLHFFQSSIPRVVSRQDDTIQYIAIKLKKQSIKVLLFVARYYNC